jgi:hypothetical protein
MMRFDTVFGGGYIALFLGFYAPFTVASRLANFFSLLRVIVRPHARMA